MQVGAAVRNHTTIRIPKQAPEIWGRMYAKPLMMEMCPVSIVARVTAGFTCPPEVFAVM